LFICVPIGGINSNGNWIHFNGSLQWSSWYCRDTCRVFGTTCGFASFGFSSIWISSFSLETMCSSPLECRVRITSIASFTSTSVITIN
jgi:hypothetical protein